MNSWIIFFLLAGGQGVFLAVLLFFSKGRNRTANSLLATFILLFSLNTFENVAYWSDYLIEAPHLAGSTRSFVFLFGPLLLLYITSATDKAWRWRWKGLVHFIPFVLYLSIRTPFYLLDESSKREHLLAQDISNPGLVLTIQIAICMHLLIYAVLIRSQLKSITSSDRMRSVVKSVSWGLGMYAITFIVYYLLVYSTKLDPLHDYILSAIGVVAIYQVGYLAIVKPEVLHGFDRREIKEKKYQKSALSPEEALTYVDEIKRLMQEERIYLHSELRLTDLALMLGISANHTSQVINEYFGKSFLELLTEFRIQEALRQLDDPGNSEKLFSVALNSGFNNRTSFTQLFKKHVGCSPQEYRLRVKV